MSKPSQSTPQPPAKPEKESTTMSNETAPDSYVVVTVNVSAKESVDGAAHLGNLLLPAYATPSADPVTSAKRLLGMVSALKEIQDSGTWTRPNGTVANKAKFADLQKARHAASKPEIAASPCEHYGQAALKAITLDGEFTDSIVKNGLNNAIVSAICENYAPVKSLITKVSKKATTAGDLD